jgi:hypothetical protein
VTINHRRTGAGVLRYLVFIVDEREAGGNVAVTQRVVLALDLRSFGGLAKIFMKILFSVRPHLGFFSAVPIRGKPHRQRRANLHQPALPGLGLAFGYFDVTGPTPNVGPLEAQEFLCPQSCQAANCEEWLQQRVSLGEEVGEFIGGVEFDVSPGR